MSIVSWEEEGCRMRKNNLEKGRGRNLNSTIGRGDTHEGKTIFEGDSEPGRDHEFLLNVIPQ